VQPDVNLARQWKVADAFLAAARAGDFAALVEVLAPDVVLRADAGTPVALRGAADVAPQVLSYARMAPFARRVLVNGAVGFVPAPGGQPFALTVRGDRVTAIHILADPDRLATLRLP
jgi:RNA polymerase sigma-70 factor (ECF subfamily)